MGSQARRRLLAVVLAAVCCGLSLAATPAGAETPPAKAWILVDAATGDILDGGNVREPVRAASAIKLLTALIAVQQLGPNASVPVSERAAAMPARKLNMGAGETWTLRDTLHSLLLSSANDAAAALGERVSGTLEDFSKDMAAAGDTLGLTDEPVLRDPSGLDDASSVGGGNFISARDLAIVARAALADATIAEIVEAREYRFTGPDGVAHHLINHNKLLSRYPDAIGMKTGYTRASGHTLVAAAERDGRRLIAVVLGAVDMYGTAAHLLDEGFATAAADAAGGRLPPVRSLAPTDELAAAPATDGGARAALTVDAIAATTADDGRSLAAMLRIAAFRLLLGLASTVGILRVRVLLRQSRRRRRTGRRQPRSGLGVYPQPLPRARSSAVRPIQRVG